LLVADPERGEDPECGTLTALNAADLVGVVEARGLGDEEALHLGGTHAAERSCAGKAGPGLAARIAGIKDRVAHHGALSPFAEEAVALQAARPADGPGTNDRTLRLPSDRALPLGRADPGHGEVYPAAAPRRWRPEGSTPRGCAGSGGSGTTPPAHPAKRALPGTATWGRTSAAPRRRCRRCSRWPRGSPDRGGRAR